MIRKYANMVICKKLERNIIEKQINEEGWIK
jgi:hypothetical protein